MDSISADIFGLPIFGSYGLTEMEFLENAVTAFIFLLRYTAIASCISTLNECSGKYLASLALPSRSYNLVEGIK